MQWENKIKGTPVPKAIVGQKKQSEKSSFINKLVKKFPSSKFDQQIFSEKFVKKLRQKNLSKNCTYHRATPSIKGQWRPFIYTNLGS